MTPVVMRQSVDASPSSCSWVGPSSSSTTHGRARRHPRRRPRHHRVLPESAQRPSRDAAAAPPAHRERPRELLRGTSQTAVPWLGQQLPRHRQRRDRRGHGPRSWPRLQTGRCGRRRQHGCYLVLEATKRNLRPRDPLRRSRGIGFVGRRASWEVPAGRGHRRTPSRDHDGVQCSNAEKHRMRRRRGSAAAPRTSLSAQSSMLEPVDASRRFCAVSPNSRCSLNSARRILCAVSGLRMAILRHRRVVGPVPRQPSRRLSGYPQSRPDPPPACDALASPTILRWCECARHRPEPSGIVSAGHSRFCGRFVRRQSRCGV